MDIEGFSYMMKEHLYAAIIHLVYLHYLCNCWGYMMANVKRVMTGVPYHLEQLHKNEDDSRR